MLPHTVAPFSQVTAMSGLGAASAAASAGACHNFTLDWIARMLADGGQVTPALATARINALSANNGAGNPVLQKAFGDRWKEGGDSYKLADKLMIMLRGLREIELTFDFTAYIEAQITAAVTAPRGRGMVYSFWFPGAVVGAAGAHTIGFFRRLAPARGKLSPQDAFVSCFDPNFGEHHVPEADFGLWLNQMFAMYGPPTHHMLKTVDER